MKYAENLSEFTLAFNHDALKEEDLCDFYYDATIPSRMDDNYQSPMEDIYESCLVVESQNAHLLLGHSGCGKSTELNALKRKLENDGRKVSVIQCLLEADRMSLVYWDLLILLGKHLCRVAFDINCRLPDSLIDNIDNFWKDIENIEIINDSSKIGIKGEIGTPKIAKLINLFAGLSTELQYGYDTRTEIREKVKRSAAQWIGYMTEVSDRITLQLGGKQPIVIFEDLDKLSPEKAWGIFDNPLSQMPFPVIYTFPISMSYDPKFTGLEASFNIHILPMIKIRTIDRAEFQDGIEVIKAIVAKRADLSLFDEPALAYLIRKTGGVLRDLFRYITAAATRARRRKSNKIELEDAKAVIIGLRSSLSRRIEKDDYSLLKSIYKGGKYKSQIENRAMLLKMMQGLIVLEYNGDRWCDLHPLIEDLLVDQGELS